MHFYFQNDIKKYNFGEHKSQDFCGRVRGVVLH